MNSFIEDFKYAWNKPNNILVRLIIINVIVWVTMNMALFVSWLTKDSSIYFFIDNNLKLQPTFATYILKPWTIITYFFTHVDFFHILYNMVFMYWFGKLIQEYLGSQKLLGLYVWGGIVGGFAYLTVYYLLNLESGGMVGASAGVYAIIVGAATFKPEYRFHLLFIGPVQLKYLAAVAVLLSFFQLPQTNTGGNIAHLGGALVGFLFIKQLQKGDDWSKPVMSVVNFFNNLFTPKSGFKVTYGKKSKVTVPKGNFKSNSKSSTEMPEQAIVDAILDKISDSGYEKLSKEEKQILFKASQKKKGS
ncbi:MAG: rhomboid family intramembrane serine protease [Bacteroidota bacterium]